MLDKCITIWLIKRLVWISLFFPLSSYANLAPFGLEIGKSTINDIHNRYHINSVEKYTNFGQIFYVAAISDEGEYPDGLNKGIKKIGFAFDDHGVLELVEIITDKNQFLKINTLLSQKYHSVNQEISPEYDHYAFYQKDNCDIFILSTFQEENMHVVYATARAHEKYTHLIPHPKHPLS